MKILVSGANSAFARAFSSSLQRKGHTVRMIGRQSQPAFSLENPEGALSTLFNEYEVFVHFAHTFEKQNTPDLNELAAQKIVDLSNRTKVRKCVYISSDSASSESQSNYGKSKFRTEQVFLNSRKSLVLRVGVITDESIPSPFATLITTVRKTGILIFPNINSRKFTHVSIEEITEKFLNACSRDIHGGPFSVCTDPNSISILELLNRCGVWPRIRISLSTSILRLPTKILRQNRVLSRKMDSIISVLTPRENIERIAEW